VQRDESRYVAGLVKQVKRLGGEPSPATGRFFDKALTLKDWPARFAFLDRGQRWVADKVVEILPNIRDAELRDFLSEMGERHTVNIARCADAAGAIGH
jgi:nitronate monooxygenase